MSTDEKFMQRCLDLAQLGAGNVAPNPMVGAVVVCDGKIIGEGYHQQYGQAHAEVNAIEAVEDKTLLEKATIYINLEPCAHFGKTPPCADLIIDSKIPNVVIGCIDSYSEVAGKGVAKMSTAGIKIRVGVLEAESLALNKRFFTYHNKNRPYVILKWAQTANGFIDIERSNNEKGVFWITQPETKALVHKWRHEEAAILVGKNTIKVDNPSLTCRNYEGASPIRVIIDQKMRLDYGAFKVGDRAVQTYVLTEKAVISKGKLQFIQPKDFTISSILETLTQLEIQSVIIEGGATTLNNFIQADIWDEARILTGINPIMSGISAPQLTGIVSESYQFGKDHIKILVHA
ncbi:MAG: bifunctional diaminohydroxyphosphoribosylaminopyrimidine deaminase/5-amino-6-(5-phosphoribosylamino)uracil reductase RibD [Crocinitomix sp.]|nr:bifunctional diaminohydroxyphosphoribosylaminopyrimidine deaminase/5-amino-6-(5-phosphoribosylamino)uracil reductase RibD [Crocinitomix sp.]